MTIEKSEFWFLTSAFFENAAKSAVVEQQQIEPQLGVPVEPGPVEPALADNPVEPPVHESWENLLAFLGMFAFAAPAVVANILIALAIVTSPKMRHEATYIAMVVLCLLDVGHSYEALYPMGTAILTGDYVPNFENRLLYFNVIYFVWYMTCVCYTTIGINRFLTICFPDLNKIVFSTRNMIIWICLWPAFSVILMSPMLSGKCCPLDFEPKLWLLRYEIGREEEFNYQLIVCYVASASTTAIGLLCYGCIIIKIHHLANGMRDQSCEQRRLRKTDVRISVQFCLLTVVFTFTWITIHYEASLGPQRSHRLLNYFGLVGYSAMSAVNPFIYLTMNRSLRRAARSLLNGVVLPASISETSTKTQTNLSRNRSLCSNGTQSETLQSLSRRSTRSSIATGHWYRLMKAAQNLEAYEDAIVKPSEGEKGEHQGAEGETNVKQTESFVVLYEAVAFADEQDLDDDCVLL